MSSNRDIRIPAQSILSLRRSLVRAVGAEAAARALQDAGHSAGDVLYERLGRALEADQVGATPRATFWDRLAALFRELGWGTLEHQELHPGVGALVGRDWFEADAESRHPTCHFTTGVLANILGRVAEEDVAVLQVECPDGSPGCCRFLFGNGDVLQGVYGALRSGRDLDAALGALR
jgi:predicted hydrocarbon binding protein